MYDVAIVGGGPAGLNAALMLGRARRRTLLFDAGRPRNAVSHAMHGFLSRDGADPAEVRRLGRQELDRYDTVEVRQDAFIFADLIIIPIINIHRKYYGWRASLYLLGLSYVAMAGAGLAVELAFQVLGIVPPHFQVAVIESTPAWNYTSFLNIAFLVLIMVLAWRFLRTGGMEMLGMMDGPTGNHEGDGTHMDPTQGRR